MATHVMTAPVQPVNQISVYGHPSPVNSGASTPANNSPTSPRQQYLPLQTRQLRPPKAPLYVPAALRPTERPSKPSPPTPPRSMHGSLDSLNDGETNEPVPRRPTLESVNSGGISKLAEDEWMKHEDLGEVTGLPTRDHWKADSASSSCDSPTCRSSFGLFLRRHHCRHCGHVFCSSHTPHMVPLDQAARFHPEGVPSRACDLCWSAYQRWEEARTDRLNKIQHQIDTQDDDTNSPSGRTSTESLDTPVADGRKSAPTTPGQEIAASVPRGWNWSTF
ncbi:Putative FYVE domain protein [Aspergillus calidoustus]|uniref:Putative FYVE domain protein n=1 Tax=Aspergillus calidoustus TaxID=454130 RepID=A0A0U5G3X3_ASPCI|nr:Putative FYVE domain protein [Aspergillus calidoustus]